MTRDTTQQWAALAELHGPEKVALISDASTKEIDRLNARAQHLLAERGHLGTQELPLPDTAYGLRTGDHVAFTTQHHPGDGQRRVENGTRGHITHIDAGKQHAKVQLDPTEREITLQGEQQLATLRLGYAQHIYRQQGATVDRAVIITGGWQTSQENAYVEASRAKEGADWHLSREDLGTQGQDPERIQRLAEMMKTTDAQTPSIAHQTADPDLSQQLKESTNVPLEQSETLDPDNGISL